MRGKAEPAEPGNVLDDPRRLSSQRIRRGRQSERCVVPPTRTDLDGVDTQDPVDIRRRVWRPGTVTMIGDDDEGETGAGGGGGDGGTITGAVRSRGVDMVGARDRAARQG